MELKKNPKADVSKRIGLFFALGLFISTLVSYIAINYESKEGVKKYEDSVFNLTDNTEDVEEVIEEQQEEAKPEEEDVQPEIPEEIKEEENTIEVPSNIGETETTRNEQVPEAPQLSQASEKEEEEDIEVPFILVEDKPVFKGCENIKDKKKQEECFQKKINDHIRDNFKYPEIAQEMGIQGVVTVAFKINKQGKVEITAVRSPDKSLEDEARRIVGLLPQFTPGKQRGKPVAVPYSLRINFKLQ